MDDILKDIFLETAVNYGEVSTDKAEELWDAYGEDFIEDVWTDIDNLIQNLINREK